MQIISLYMVVQSSSCCNQLPKTIYRLLETTVENRCKANALHRNWETTDFSLNSVPFGRKFDLCMSQIYCVQMKKMEYMITKISYKFIIPSWGESGKFPKELCKECSWRTGLQGFTFNIDSSAQVSHPPLIQQSVSLCLEEKNCGLIFTSYSTVVWSRSHGHLICRFLILAANFTRQKNMLVPAVQWFPFSQPDPEVSGSKS